MVWDGIIATYLFLAGLGAGAFAFAALVGFVKPDAVKLRTIGYVIAPIAVGVGTVLLMVDAKAGLMNPLRFFGLLGNFSSIMAWGVVILIAFMAVSVISLVVMIVKKGTPKALDVVGLVCAVAVAVYTGMLLGDAPGFPLWNPVVLPLLFLVSAASTGFAAVLLVAHLMKAEGLESLGFLRKTGLVLPVAEAVLIAALLGVVAGTGGSAALAAAASVASLAFGAYAVPFWLGLVLIGLALPFCLELYRTSKARKAADGAGATGLAVTGEASVLVGGFLLRYLVIMAAVPVVLF